MGFTAPPLPAQQIRQQLPVPPLITIGPGGQRIRTPVPQAPAPTGGVLGGFEGVATLLGKVASFVSPFIKARGEQQIAAAQQVTFQFNAQVAQQRAQLVRERGKIDIERQRRRARAFSASQRAAFAAAGVRLTGSPLEVLIADAAELEFDALITKFNTENDVLAEMTNADISLFRAQQARDTGAIRARTALLSAIPRLTGLIG